MDITILGIESSCDDTSAAVLRGNVLLSNVIASQAVHVKYGGVIPELASRAHQQNIIPVVDTALKEAGITADDLDAIAFTRGPGLVGSLLVGVSFTKGLSIARNIPMVEVNHLQGHILSHFIDLPDRKLPHPDFPFLCLLVSGGHTQIVRVDAPTRMEIIGTTIDDAAGEAFDKCAKVMGLPYPGGPVIDRLAKEGDPKAFRFAHPHVDGYDYSFSGLKTSFLYTLRDAVAGDPNFIEEHKADLCASLQNTVVEILLDKLIRASKDTGIRDIAIGGGVSANSGLRNGIVETGRRRGWRTFLPEFKFTTDNAAMIAMAGYYRYKQGEFSSLDVSPEARMEHL
ncbi:MAG TPA: tRNA (adenosine(37)-N6)-threonylcarbamoyltransferase complex transferase subunit TsaD [Candidatus Alistipes faecigallinarum]|uniref:tRNA (adenosine(37)-N6)-threonylcarbamoyltransferase complex transferase subunit TsaD n=1 Tax=uncultured Alistipes sp. TaxID=538949 RepID=UPI001F962976|nr:tRNA (adenosine(37)-N6)-threonylcarbamoyltransferase complex transferase subunit TsaD [uncultured Alistipes sp.]HIY46827.1 tRNA (adenosine(37)-N6)-threonylcarbamoyltransferase complex transferase subunit TsaD [Candidatus Alistipes faecigallinarum]